MSNALTFKRGKGHRPVRPGRRPGSVLHHPRFAALLAGTASLPSSTNNRAHCCPILDQGQTGECEAHTEAEATFASLSIKGTPLNDVPSPTDLYQLANGLQRAANNPGVAIPDLPALEDGGLEPVFATQAASKFGVTKTHAVDGLSDADPTTAASEADPDEIIKSSTKLVRGTAAIDLPADQRINALCRLLAAGKVVKVALFADSDEFQGYGPDSAPISAPASNPGSDHAVLLVDYYTDASGKIVFIFQNHWSTGWGKSGWGEADESFVQTWTDLEVVDAELAAVVGGAS